MVSQKVCDTELVTLKAFTLAPATWKTFLCFSMKTKSQSSHLLRFDFTSDLPAMPVVVSAPYIFMAMRRTKHVSNEHVFRSAGFSCPMDQCQWEFSSKGATHVC